jgi:hypothetical protein
MFEWLNTVSNYSPLFPFVAGVILRKVIDRSSRIVMILVICAAFSQLFSRFHFGLPSVWPVFNMYILLDSSLWALVFYTNSHHRIVCFTIVSLFLLEVLMFFLVVFVTTIEKRFLSEFVCFNCLLQVMWVLLFLYERYRKDAIRSLEFEPLFWYSLGLLVYSPTTYFLFAYYHIVRQSTINGYESLWAIHDVMNILMYVLFGFGMLCNMKAAKFTARV